MDDANSVNFGQSGPKGYGETKITTATVGGQEIKPKTAGSFAFNRLPQKPAFDAQLRLGGNASGMNVTFGPSKGPRRSERSEAEIELINAKAERKQKLFLIDTLLEQLEKSPWSVTDLDKKVSELKDIQEAVDVTKNTDDFVALDIRLVELRQWAESGIAEVRDQEDKANLEKRLYKGEWRRWFVQLDSKASKLRSSPEYQAIKDLLEALAWLKDDDQCDQYADEATTVEASLSKIESMVQEAEERVRTENIAHTTKEQLDKLTLLTNLRRRYDLLARDIISLKNTTLSVTGKDPLIGEYESYSFINTEDSPSPDDIKIVSDRLPELERLVSAATQELSISKKEEARKQRQLEIAATIATTNFRNKKLEALSLLASDATIAEKDSTEKLIDEIKGLEAGLLSDSITQAEIDTFDQKLSELDAKIASLKNLVEIGSKEKTDRIRQAEQLIAIFEQRKSQAETLLLNPVTTGESTATRTLVAEVEILSTALKNSNDIETAEVNIFTAKIVELEDKITELQTLIDVEKSRQESMSSWHAQWPKAITYAQAKKPTRPGMPGEKGGWKKDGKMLPDQAIWGKASDQSTRVFEKYNSLVDKILSLGKEEEAKDLILTKEAVVNALYAEKPEDALKELTKLEKEVAVRGPGIENATELKDLSARFSVVATTLERLSPPTISTLEKTLLDAKKQELDQTLLELNKDTTRGDVVKSKELLRLFKVILEELSSAVNEKEKEVKLVAGARLTEFKTLAGKLEAAKLTITSRLATVLSVQEKESMSKKVGEIEERAKKFSEYESGKDYTKARETLILFRADLEELGEEIEEKVNLAKKLKAEQKEKLEKAQEAKKAFAKEFSDAKGFFGKLKSELDGLGLAGEKKVAFDRRIKELSDLVVSFEDEKTDAASAKNILGLFKAILGEFSTFVTQEFRNNPTKKTELEEAYKAINKGSILRPAFSRVPKKDATITLAGTRDPLTGKSKTMTVEGWEALQQEKEVAKKAALLERKQKTELELRETHKKMFERDPEAYKNLYAGRAWGPESELTQKIVGSLLEEKVAAVDKKLWDLEPEILRRRGLSAKVLDLTTKLSLMQYAMDVSGNQQEDPAMATLRVELDRITKELADLDDLIMPYVVERKSLTDRPYEEQMRALRGQATQDGSLRDWTFSYSPALDKSMDWIGFDNRTLSKEERKRFIKASYQRRVEALREAKDKIPGFTKATTNTIVKDSLWSGKKVDPITAADLGDENAKLAKAAFPVDAKIGTKEAERNSGGMARSVMEEDTPKNTDSKILKEVNKGAFEMPAQVTGRAPLTVEEQERRMAKVGSLLNTVTKFAKNNWRAFVTLGLAGVGFGMAGIASAATTVDPSRLVTTLGEMASWKDFVGGLDEREGTRLAQFIKDLTGK